MQLIALPERVPRRGSALWRFIGRSVLRLYGWSVVGELPNLPKFVIAVAPHTSNWDVVMGAATMFAIDLKLAFMAKHTLFQGPLAGLLRWMGGIPVDRSSAHGVVAQAVDGFQRSSQRVLVITPEGTRKRVEKFKTGFLHVARGAGVPVVLATLDYGNKWVRFGPAFEPGSDVEADRERVEAFFKPVQGKRAR